MGHGKSGTRLYGIWSGMKDRCYNPNCKGYHHYGGRGIVVCNEWKHDFMAFYEWAMAAGYDETAPRGQYTIERMDNNGPYSPENCRWATIKEQERNRRCNIMVQVGNQTMALSEACEKLGLKYANETKSRQRRAAGIRTREEYLSDEKRKKVETIKVIEENPDMSIRQLAKLTGKSKSTIQRFKDAILRNST